MKLHPLFQRLIRDERGGLLTMVAAALPVVIIAAGIAYDLNVRNDKQSLLQKTIDQAALAAVSVDPEVNNTTRAAIVENFVNMNLNLANQDTIELISLDTVENLSNGVSVEVTIVAHVSTPLSSLFGQGYMVVENFAEAKRNVQNAQFTVSFPMSGVQCSEDVLDPDPEGLPGDILLAFQPDPTCATWNAIRDGIENFITHLDNNAGIAEIEASLVPFSAFVKMPDLNNIPPELENAEIAQDPNQDDFYTNFSSHPDLMQVLPMTDDMGALNFALDSATLTDTAPFGMRDVTGTLVSAMAHDPDYQTYFGGNMPVEFGDASTLKIAIMIGESASNMGCCFTSNGTPPNFSQHYVYHYLPDLEQQIAYCEAMQERGIVTYSIVMDADNAQGPVAENAAARCGGGSYTGPGDPNDPEQLLECDDFSRCFKVENGQQMNAALAGIADSLNLPYIAQ